MSSRRHFNRTYNDSSDSGGGGGDDDSMSDLIDFGIDDLHKLPPTEIERQINIIRTYLFTDRNDDPKFYWRALWSIEEHHDRILNGLRWKHFHRWDRDRVPKDDPYRDEVSKVIYFPGMNASHDAKVAWAGMVVEECAGNDMRPAWDRTWERDYDIPALDEAPALVSDILIACAPDTLSVCLYIERKKVDAFLALVTIEKGDDSFHFCSSQSREERDEMERKIEARRHNPGLEDIKKFLSSPYIRNDAPSQVKLNSDEEVEQTSDEAAKAKLARFKQWLEKEASDGGTLRQETAVTKLPPQRYDELTFGSSFRARFDSCFDKDLVLLARRDGVSKGEKSEVVLNEMMLSLGICEDLVRIGPTLSRNPDIHGYTYMTSNQVGGNIHYPDVGGRTSIAFTWSSTEKLTEEVEERRRYRQAFETDYVRNARSKKKSSGGRLYLMFWPRSSNEEHGHFPRSTTAVTSENSHMIWLPGEYDNIEEETFKHCLNEGGGPFIMRGTYEGNIFWQTVLKYFDDVIIEGKQTSSLLREYQTIPNKYSLKLCLLLSLTRVLIEAESMLQDHEYEEEEIREFFESLSYQWRKVWRKSDETLGLGLASSDCQDPDVESPRATRQGLYAMLKFYGSKVERLTCDMDIGTVSFVPFSRHR